MFFRPSASGSISAETHQIAPAVRRALDLAYLGEDIHVTPHSFGLLLLSLINDEPPSQAFISSGRTHACRPNPLAGESDDHTSSALDVCDSVQLSPIYVDDGSR